MKKDSVEYQALCEGVQCADRYKGGMRAKDVDRYENSGTVNNQELRQIFGIRIFCFGRWDQYIIWGE